MFENESGNYRIPPFFGSYSVCFSAVSDWGACEFGEAFDRYYFGKSPLEDPQLYIKMAPLSPSGS